MRIISKEKWFNRTLFVITADHTKNRSVWRLNDKIPLILYAPKFLKHKKISTLGSQIDIIPTIMHLMGLPMSYSTFGKSLLSNNPTKRSVISYRPPLIAIRNKYGILKHDLIKTVHSDIKNSTHKEDARKKLLKFEQAIYFMVKNNKL